MTERKCYICGRTEKEVLTLIKTIKKRMVSTHENNNKLPAMLQMVIESKDPLGSILGIPTCVICEALIGEQIIQFMEDERKQTIKKFARLLTESAEKMMEKTQ